MTIDLDVRGRAAATAVRDLVDATVDESTTDDAVRAAMGRGQLAMRVQEGRVTARRGPRVAVAVSALVAAAAAVAALVFLVRDRPQQSPVVPPTTGGVPSSTIEATTTTDEASLSNLATVGPKLELGQYPPQVFVLNDGRVVRPLADRLEVTDPTTGAQDELGPMRSIRDGAAYVEIAGGRLLIVGGDFTGPDANGFGHPAARATAEVLDLTTGGSESLGVIPGVERNSAVVATLLDDGTVLAIFAGDESLVFDPETMSFTPTQPRPQSTGVFGLFPLNDGRVLVFSGNPSVYDPDSRAFSELAGFMGGGKPTTMVQLADGRILSVYGWCGEVHGADAQGLSEGYQPVRTQLFDPVTGQFSEGPPLPHCVTTATLMPSGRVFVAGYWWRDSHEVTWSGVLDLPTGETLRMPKPNREYGTAVTLRDGRVLVVAGNGDTWADIYDETGT